MKFVIVLLSVLTFSCAKNTKASVGAHDTVVTASDQEQGITKVVSVDEFRTLIQGEDVQLIDVRTPEEYASGKIAHAKNVNFYDANFKAQMSALDKESPVAVYCKSGGRSGRATKMLKALGFAVVYDLKGGYTAWDAPLQ